MITYGPFNVTKAPVAVVGCYVAYNQHDEPICVSCGWFAIIRDDQVCSRCNLIVHTYNCCNRAQGEVALCRGCVAWD